MFDMYKIFSLIKECFRVLVPEGLLLIGTENFNCKSNLIYKKDMNTSGLSNEFLLIQLIQSGFIINNIIGLDSINGSDQMVKTKLKCNNLYEDDINQTYTIVAVKKC